MITTKDLEGPNLGRSMKFITIAPITYAAVAKMLELPTNWTIVAINDISTDNTISLKVLTTTSKDVPEGAPMPEVSPGQMNWTI